MKMIKKTMERVVSNEFCVSLLPSHVLPVLLAFCMALLLLCSCGKGDISKSSQVLARVGDREITTAYFDRQLANLPESVQKLSLHGEGKKAILEGFVNREILYTEALKKKIDKDPELVKKFEDMKKELIINAYLQNQIMGKIKVEDKEVADFYNNNPGEFRNREEIRISQIVVPDEATAREMLDKLGIRRDFGELAQAHSIDKASAERKGDVGWFTYKKLPEEIRDAVFRMKVGEVSKPYKMADGWEIYKITDRKTISYNFDQVKDVIRMHLSQEKFQKELKTLLDGLKKNTPVQVNEALLK
ncbi:MAG TPA: peptidyl-prolyl cis-trans isomerase [Geobacteraceae bacterium]|nr:peptidyl-prolyl cis-trans isomerase [Geobacteraceae bacterium]